MSRRTAKNHYHSDEDFIPEDNETETLISRNKPPRNKAVRKPAKKTVKRPGSPFKTRSQSAPPNRSSRDLWMTAVKRQHTVGIAQGKHPESPRHKTPIEFWVDTLRKTGTGISTESTGMNTFSGLKKKNDMNMAYLSSSHYLRQVAGTEKPRRHDDPTAKPSPGTPAYKTPEEYYDEVLGLRKQIATLSNEITTMRAKNRRLEEDKIKKDKEMEGLLNPGKSDEIRRTLGDKNPDSGAVIHSLKQKILKLEMQLRDRESTVSKLQSDLKTTKVDELRAQMEIFYQEMLRLQQSKDTGVVKNSRGGKENSVKVRALNETVLRLNQQNQQLIQDNRALNEDLRKALDEADDGPKREYEDMNRKQLLKTISSLEKRLAAAGRKYDGDADSVVSFESQRTVSKKKLVLEGSLEERLQQLDQRETELLDEVAHLKATIKRLRDERSAKKEDKRSALPPQPSPRQRRGSRPASASSVRSVSRVDEDNRQRELQSKIARFQENHAAKTVQRGWRSHREQQREHARKVQHFTEEHAAKHIQHRWLDYKQKKHDDEMDDVAYFLQGTLKANTSRKKLISRTHLSDYDTDSTDREDMNDAAFQISSAIRGHRARKSRIQMLRQDSYGEDEVYSTGSRRPGSASRRPSSATRRPSAASLTRPSSGYKRTFHVTNSPSADDDDDIMEDF